MVLFDYNREEWLPLFLGVLVFANREPQPAQCRNPNNSSTRAVGFGFRAVRLLRPSVAELFCFIEIGLRLSIFALGMVSHSPVVIGFGVFGFQPERLAKIADGIIVLLLFKIGVAAQIECFRIVWIRRDPRAVIANCRRWCRCRCRCYSEV